MTVTGINTHLSNKRTVKIVKNFPYFTHNFGLSAMDRPYFESLLKSLTKTQHKRRLVQILTALRKETNNAENVNILQAKGTLKYIVACLQQDSRSIIDNTLSILGNCSCLNPECGKSLVSAGFSMQLLLLFQWSSKCFFFLIKAFWSIF